MASGKMGIARIILLCFAPVTLAIKFTQEPSVTDMHSPTGRLRTVPVADDAACMAECYLEGDCVSVGYAENYGSCQLYRVDVANFANDVIAQLGTVFYKSICADGYTSVRRLTTCLKRYDTPAIYDDARTQCQGDGADMLEVETNEKRVYLKETLLQIHDPSVDFLYFIGGRNVGGIWSWEKTGTNITIDSGAVFWAEGEPQNANGNCVAVKSFGGSDLAFVVTDCNTTHNFVCAQEMAPSSPYLL